MDDDLRRELSTLRARAYGPDPDIHDDPAALTRLRELEELARGAAPVSAAPEPEAEPTFPPKPPLPPVPPLPVSQLPVSQLSAATPLPDAPTEPEPAVADAPESTDRARRKRWTKKRLVLTWIASLGVAILVTATVTGFVSRRVQADPREVAVLGVNALAQWPEIFGVYNDDGEREQGFPEGGAAFERFYGMIAFRLPDGMYSYRPDESCLVVVDAEKIYENSNSYDAPVFNGCAAGTFAATAEIVVTSGSPQNLPDELLDAFPEGTALQFVLDGDEVVVLSDQP